MGSRRGPDIDEAALHVEPFAAIPLHLEPMVEDGGTSSEGTYGADLRDLLGDDEPEDNGDDMVIPGLLAANVPGVLVGPPKAFKSFLMLAQAVCVAAGIQLFGRFPARRGRVLVLEREDNVRETCRRIWRIARGLAIDPRDLEGHLRVDAVQPFYFDDAAHVAQLRRTLDSWPASVVFMDSLRRVHRGDENSSKDLQVVTSTWSSLCAEYGAAIVVVHHMRKPGATGDFASAGQRMRGSGDLFALVRHLVAVEPRVKEGVSIVSAEGNLAGIPEPFAFRLVDGTDASGKATIQLEYAGAAGDASQAGLDDAVVAAIARHGTITSTKLRKEVGGRAEVVDSACLRLLAAGRIARENSRTPWHLVTARVA